MGEAQYDGQALGLLYMAIMDTMKKSCKISDIQYGPLHVKEGQNRTRLELHIPPTLYRTQQYEKFTPEALQSSIGGYLGLYLGVSLLQVHDLVRLLATYLTAASKACT